MYRLRVKYPVPTHNFRGTIVDCSTLITVEGNNLTGGIAGMNSVNAQIINSHAKGKVIATRVLSGLVGQNIGLIKYSSYTGDVEATAEAETRVGGLVGLNLSAIRNSYSVATVTGITNYGGLVGFSGGDLHAINTTPPASIRTVSASLYQTLPLKQNQHTAMLPGVYLNWKTLIRLTRLTSNGILNRAPAILPYGGSIFRPLNPVQTLTRLPAQTRVLWIPGITSITFITRLITHFCPLYRCTTSRLQVQHPTSWS